MSDDSADPPEPLVWYTIFAHPRGFLAVECTGADGFIDLVGMGLVPTLEEARALIPEGLDLIPRDPADAPGIVETWS